MNRAVLLILLLVFATAGFVVGNFRNQHHAAPGSAAGDRRVLYYVDPMNPTHTSDQPGLAPCGMKLEPVYADGPSGTPGGNIPGVLAAGSVRISPERQQLAGIQVSKVEKKPLPYRLRLPGKVVVDEARVYRIKAALSGYLGHTLPHSTGSRVQMDEVLAELNSPELLPAVQSLLFAVGTRNPPVDGTALDLALTNSLFEFDLSYQQSLESLRHMGMGQHQIGELIRTRKLVKSIAITSPANGVLITRNVSEELHVEKGEELFRVADLGRVWILTDVAGWESDYLKPGSEVRVSVPRQAKTIMATVSKSLPMFDNDSRTLKVRIEADNPDYSLRPDMFVDVEFSLSLPEMILISADAVLDTGSRQTVFLDQGDGCFEPQQVKTGRHLGELVEIVHGLAAGDRIVTAGNFLLDSESRMKQAAATHAQAATTKDPVCNMTVDAQEVAAEGQVSVYQGQSYYFCDPGCKRSFDADPAKFLKPPSTHAANTALATSASDHCP